jgi:hypothetical protein
MTEFIWKQRATAALQSPDGYNRLCDAAIEAVHPLAEGDRVLKQAV